MRKFQQVAFVLVLLPLSLLIGAVPAMASGNFPGIFNSVYPNSQSANNASCQLCHTSSTSQLNQYGRDWAVQLRSGMTEEAAFQAIQGAQSDTDSAGATNITEINASAQPGWTPGANNTTYVRSSLAVAATGVSPPTTITGLLDPPSAGNRPPVLAAIGAKSVNEGQLLTFTATATDPDGNALTFSGGSMPTGATLSAAGVFSWTPSFAQAGNYNVTVTVTDNGSPAASDFEVVTITVGNVNRPPVLNPIGAKSVNENQALTFTATATDPDGNALTFSGGNLPTGATLTPAGAFNWTPTFDQAGNYNVTITVTDNGSPAASDFEVVTITVGNVNRPPVLNPIGAKSVNENQALTFTATATDPDGNALTFSGGNLPTGATLTPAGAFSWTPTSAQAGSFSVTITVTDNGSPAQNDSEIVTITVGNVNQPPVLAPIGAKSVNENQALTFTATATDPDGGTLTFAGSNLPSGATLTPAGAFSWTPTFAQAGNYDVTVTVSDGVLTDSEIVTITVGNVNRPPVLSPSPIGNRTVTAGQPLTIAITATDPDGGTLTFTSANLPTGATLTPSGNGAATFSWTPTTGQAGSYPGVTITVSDGALTDAEIFTITVNPASSVPATLTTPTPGSTLTGTTATFTWSPGSGVAEYYLQLGTAAGASNLYNASTGTAQSVTVAGLPGGSLPLYVRLWSRFGTTWQYNDYSVTAMSGAGNSKATLTTPTPGSTLTGTTATFTWSPGSGVAEYYLQVGTVAGGSLLYSASTGTAQSVSVAGLPGGSVPLYVRLYSRFGTTWQYNDYSLTAMSGAGNSKATLTTPTPGSTLTGTTATFTWSPGSGVAEYYLQLWHLAGGLTLYNASTGTAQSVTVAGLPGGSVPLYVRLWSRFGTTWQYNDYSLTAAP